jgi:hypothetical protein
MDAIQFLKQEHQKAKAAFENVLKAGPASRGQLWTKLQPELETHEQIEDACLYAPLSREGSKTARRDRNAGDEGKEGGGCALSGLTSRASRRGGRSSAPPAPSDPRKNYPLP